MLDNNEDLRPDAPQDDWLDLQTARAKLREHISRFLTTNAGWQNGDENTPHPVLGLKVSAGLGKTRTALECIAKHGRAFLERGHILFYVPTLDLAAEAENTFRKLNSGHPSFVLRGRNAINPETATPMCARSEIAKEIAKSVPSVTQAICREKRKTGGTIKAACAKGCPYLAQEAITKPHVVFLAHSYLNSKPLLSCPVALRIIDEKFWKEMIDHQELSHDDWLFTPDHVKKANLTQHYELTRRAISDALEAKKPVHLALRDNKISANILRKLAKAEARAVPALKLNPRLADDIVKLKIKAFDHVAANNLRVRSLIFSMLAETIGKRGTERISLAKPSEQSGNRAVIKVHQLDELPADAPAILLDADLDETIVRRFFDNAQFEQLRVRPKAHVIQVSDKTLASSTLKDPGCQKRRADVVRIIKREVERAKCKKVLVVATRTILRALYEDNSEVFKEASTQPQMLHGATVRWFGPKLLGINAYSDFATVIIVGRLQLPVVVLEDQLRALFGDTDVPLTLTDNARLVASATSVLHANDERVDAKFQSHPDPRGTSLLQQSREAQSEQAIARLRLLDANVPKRVLVLSNVPLPGLPVNEWLKFDAVVQDKSDAQVSKKYRKLERAISGTDGHKLRGLRLSPIGLRDDAPDVFSSFEAAKEYRKKLPSDEILNWAATISADMGLSATYVRLSNGKRGGHATPAVVFTTAKNAEQLSKQLWPEFDKHVVIEDIGITLNEENAVLEAIL